MAEWLLIFLLAYGIPAILAALFVLFLVFSVVRSDRRRPEVAVISLDERRIGR